MAGDLHCHTKLSDGSMGIDDIIILAEKLGITTLAITDHDCLAGTVRAKIVGERRGIKVIPGVEISAYDKDTDSEVHILGYLCDSPDRLEGLCNRNRIARKRAAQYMMIKTAQKYPVTTDFIIQCAQASTSVYPMHIMTALMEIGVTTELYGELYHQLFDEKSPTSILVKPKFESPESVIKAIHDAGGIAILAHPGKHEGTDILDKALEAGIDGIEAWCPDHSDEQAEKYAALAKKNKILAIGGSNFHGRFNKTEVTLGSYSVTDENLSEFNNYKAKIRRQQKAKANA